MARTATLPLPPGPKGHLIRGNLPEMRRGILDFLSMCAREYGDIVYLRAGPRPTVLLNHPDYIEYVLANTNRTFNKGSILRSNRRLLGDGLLTSGGDFWRRQRRLAQPAFHRERIDNYGRIMVDYTERMLSTWQDGETRDVHADMMRLTLAIVAKTLFDADIEEEAEDVGAALAMALNGFNARISRLILLPDTIPTPGNLPFLRAVRKLDEIVYGIIRQRRATGEDRGDLLSLLLHAQDEDDKSRMTDKQLRDEAMTIILAGHETTAIAMSWTWYLLAQHPQVEARLMDELREVLGDRPPTVTDLPKLRYTEMIVTESMRLYPPAWSIGRQPVEDCEIGGYRVPAGTHLLMCQWLMHRDPRYFERPTEFYPERWADGLALRLPRYAYFPFGGGPRLCIGNSFAMMEAVLLLATIARRYQLTLVPDHPVSPWPSITLRPRYGMKMTISRR